MNTKKMDVECKPAEQTTGAGHWLYANMPEHHTELQREVGRLQRTIAALIAIGAVTEGKARQAYDIAGW
jgi:hypothetical protein